MAVNNIQFVNCQRVVRKEKHRKHILSIVWPQGNEQSVYCRGYTGEKPNHKVKVRWEIPPKGLFITHKMWVGTCLHKGCKETFQYWSWGAALGATLEHYWRDHA